MDSQGFLTLLDRAKDLVISGGSNIYPREIEDVLLEHPRVAEAAVIGVPDPEWGESVVAAVIRREDWSHLGADALIAFCRDYLASFKKPKRIAFLEELPKNAYGKVLRGGNKLRLVVEVRFLHQGVSVEIESWMLRATPLEFRL